MVISIQNASGAQVPCEAIKNYEWSDVTRKTCFMNGSTAINGPTYTISSSRDESVAGFDCDGNPKIVYLPVKIHEKFPHLSVLYADGCSIKSISKENFENLVMLKRISLNKNQIEIVHSDTFDDLTALEFFWMRRLK